MEDTITKTISGQVVQEFTKDGVLVKQHFEIGDGVMSAEIAEEVCVSYEQYGEEIACDFTAPIRLLQTGEAICPS